MLLCCVEIGVEEGSEIVILRFDLFKNVEGFLRGVLMVDMNCEDNRVFVWGI